jgi:hypothetical protein
MVAALFAVELNKEPFTVDLVQCHVKRTFSCDVNVLTIDIVIDLRYFKHERGIKTDLLVLGKVWN